MDSKAKFKLGTFVKNCVFGRKEFVNLISELGVDRRTDPVYVLELAEQQAPEALYEIMTLATKTSQVKELAEEFLEKEI